MGLLMRPVPMKPSLDTPDLLPTAASGSIIFSSIDHIPVDASIASVATMEGKETNKHTCTCAWQPFRKVSLKQRLPEIVVMIGYFLLHCGHQNFIAFQPSRAVYLGFTKNQGAFVVSMYGIMSGIFRIPMGWIGDRKCVARVLLCGIGGIFAGSCTILSTFLKDYTALLIYASFYGLGIGKSNVCHLTNSYLVV